MASLHLFDSGGLDLDVGVSFLSCLDRITLGILSGRWVCFLAPNGELCVEPAKSLFKHCSFSKVGKSGAWAPWA